MSSQSGVLTLVFTERGLFLSTEPWEEWRGVQVAVPDYKTSLGGYSIDALFEYLALDYAADALPFDRSLVEAFINGGGRRLWALGDGWGDMAKRPTDLTVTDQFDVTDRGLVLAVEPSLPVAAPLGDHQATVSTPGGTDRREFLRLSLVHFNPGGYSTEVSAPYSVRDRFPIGSRIRFDAGRPS